MDWTQGPEVTEELQERGKEVLMQELFFLCYYAVVWKMKKKGVLAITLEWIGTLVEMGGGGIWR